MEQAQTSSISINPELMAAVEEYAGISHQTIQSVAEEALRSYVCLKSEQNAIRQHHLQRAAELGLDIDDYVARLIKEWRREEREKAELYAPARS